MIDPPEAATLPDTAAEPRLLPLAVIDPPPDNPRRDFAEGELERLALSIERNGLLQPVIVRPKGQRFELVAGERRLRACRRVGTETIAVTVRSLDDLAAAEVRLLENLDRADLNPVEEADAFRRLCDLGHSADSVAELVRRGADAVRGRLDLLRLPGEWQERVRRGELTAAAAEYLTEYAGHRDVLAGMDAEFRTGWPMPLNAWHRRLVDLVLCVSRSLEPDAPDGPRFDPSPGQRKALDAVSVRHPGGRKERRALNLELWDRLQDAAELPDAGGGGPDPGPDRPAKECAAVHRVVAFPAEDPATVAADWAARWLRDLLAGHLDELDAAGLWRAAVTLGVDPAGAWRLDRGFLEACGPDGVRELADEFGVDVSAGRTDAERAAILAHAAGDRMPAAVRAAVGLADGGAA